MSEAKTKVNDSRSISTPARPEDRAGLVRLGVDTTADLVERSSANIFQGVREIREELQGRTTDLVDQLEKIEGAVNRAIRVVITQGHAIARDAIDSVESLVLGMTRSLRGVAAGTADLAARAVVGQPNAEVPSTRASA